MKLLNGILSVAIVFAFAASFAEADGKKANCTICVKNKSRYDVIGVILDPDPNSVFTTPQEFQAAGGVLLSQGEEKCFEVKAGDHIIAAGIDFNKFELEETDCAKGQKRCYEVRSVKDIDIEIFEVECNNGDVD